MLSWKCDRNGVEIRNAAEDAVSICAWLQGTLALTVTLWSVGDSLLGINNATTSLLGVGMLLLGDVLTWEDCLSEKNGWDCFMWFSIMITLAAGV